MKKIRLITALLVICGTLPVCVFLVMSLDKDEPSVVATDEAKSETQEAPTKPSSFPMYGKLEAIPESVRPLFLEGNRASDVSKLETVNQLSDRLVTEDREALYVYLCNGENTQQSLHIKDEVMRKLESQQEFPEEYIPSLIRMVKDHALDGELRGYIVQHLRSAYEGQTDVKTRGTIESVLLECGNDSGSDISGTAILALAELVKQGADLDRKKVEGLAQTLAENESCHIPSRIMAIRACGILKCHAALPAIRRLSEHGNDMTLRLSAIASLGDLGDSVDLTILEGIRKNGHPLFRKAATVAAGKIQRRDDYQ